jgi:hypothetical protein
MSDGFPPVADERLGFPNDGNGSGAVIAATRVRTLLERVSPTCRDRPCAGVEHRRCGERRLGRFAPTCAPSACPPNAAEVLASAERHGKSDYHPVVPARWAWTRSPWSTSAFGSAAYALFKIASADRPIK